MPAADLPSLSPEDRRRELARLLARGLLRLCRRRACDPSSDPKNLSESERDGLAIPGETRLSVHTG